ncbi:PIF1 [Symbiodinium sp. CCMP2592]|nr:PIF1 [Symbiodinium sp. CCMP2592]
MLNLLRLLQKALNILFMLRMKDGIGRGHVTTRKAHASICRDCIEAHRRFLRKHPGATEQQRRRLLSFNENEGLECCLWPHLYWRNDMMETYVRLSDVRRLRREENRDVAEVVGRRPARGRKRTFLEMHDEDASEENVQAGRTSVKFSFMRKALGPIIGYSTNFELLSFVYDLLLWSKLGATKNVAKGLPLRLALQTESDSPLYWQTRHQALLDMQRQCGFPVLFKTMAPWEWSFPYHTWVLDEMQKADLGRMGLAGPETLHTAHVFAQLEMGLYTGHNAQVKTDAAAERKHPGWSDHILADPTDGQRKLPTQGYHGSGRVHCHSLNFGCHFARARLADQMMATVPACDQPALRGYMLGRPHGRDDSGWPVELEESRWDEELGRVRLQHTGADKAAGHRAFFKETLEITKCHQDVLHCDRRANSMKYCATYNAKFSDSFAQDWLCDDISGNAVARKVLFEYHPCEPEMWLYIGGRLAPPCQYSGTMVSLRVPLPTPGAEKNKLVELYEKSQWRGDDMTFLEWLRKSNADGKIARWVQLRHKRLVTLQQTKQSLPDFARTCSVNGEKLIAADVLAMSNDKICSTLRLRQPCPPPTSSCNAKIETLLAMLRANLYLVEQCVHGGLRLPTAADERAALRRGGLLDDEDEGEDADAKMQWNPEQARLQRKVNQAVDRSLAHRAEEDDDERAEEKRQESWKHSTVIAGIGPPGTGKTTAVDVCVRRTLRRGGRVLYALPTGQQAARVRGRFLTCDVDTCSGAFGLWQSSQDALHLLDLLSTYDLVVVDEVSQLSKHDFNRILKLWDAASRMPALVFIGDFHQLPGVEPTNAKDSARWPHVFKVDLWQMWRCQDPALMAKLRLLRLNQPTEQQLRDICRWHKAWSQKNEPAAYDVLRLHRDHPDTVLQRSLMSVQVLFSDRGKKSLGTVDTDWESNVDNYLLDGKLKSGCPPRPQPLALFAGLKLHLTRNLDKPGDFVNGMAAVVQSFHRPSGCLRVLTQTGKHLAVYPVTEFVEDCGTVTAYPIRAGYACTIHKLQGAELPHVTVWLDVKHMRAAGYVAISRVRTDDAYLLASLLTPEHFTPAV